MPDIDLGVEAESYMMDMPHAASWVQPDNASNLLFNPGEMNLPVFDVNIDAVNPLDQTCCPDLTPELPSGWDDSLVGFDGSGNWYNAEYSEMTSPSSQAESIDLTDASLSHDFLNQLIQSDGQPHVFGLDLDCSRAAGAADLCAILSKDSDISSSDSTTNFPASDDFENNLNNLLETYKMSIKDLAYYTKDVTANSFTYDKAINNITTTTTTSFTYELTTNNTTMDNQLANYFQGVDLDTNYFQGVDLDSAPGDLGMNIELLSPDSNGMGDGSTASVEDTSSDIDLDGQYITFQMDFVLNI